MMDPQLWSDTPNAHWIIHPGSSFRKLWATVLFEFSGLSLGCLLFLFSAHLGSYTWDEHDPSKSSQTTSSPNKRHKSSLGEPSFLKLRLWGPDPGKHKEDEEVNHEKNVIRSNNNFVKQNCRKPQLIEKIHNNAWNLMPLTAPPCSSQPYASVYVYLDDWFYYDPNKTNKPKHVGRAWETKNSFDRK